MEKIINYYKLKILPSIKDLQKNKINNISLYLIIFSLLLSFNLIFITHDVNKKMDSADAGDYNYHIVFRNITENQLETLININDGSYKIVTAEKIHDDDYEDVFDIYIKLNKITGSFYGKDYIVLLNSFMQNFQYYLTNYGRSDVTYELSPLFYENADYTLTTFIYYVVDMMSLKRSNMEITSMLDIEVPYIEKPLLGYDPNLISENTYQYVKIFIGFCLITIFVLLYTVENQLERRKYIYGLYSAFGAKKHNLKRTMKIEFLILSIIINLISYLCALILTFINTKITGTAFYIPNFLPLFISPLMIYFLSHIIISIKINIFSKNTILSHLKRNDNGSFLVSPRFSYNIKKNSFIIKYILIHMRRYRKYYVTLSVMIFICTVFIFTTHIESISITDEQFKIQYNSKMEYEIYNKTVLPSLTQIDGVDKSVSEISVNTEDIGAHIFFDSDVNKKYGKVKIICSESETDNSNKVTIAIPRSQKSDFSLHLNGGKLHEAYQQSYNFDYYECGVGDNFNGFEINVSRELYLEMIGKSYPALMFSHIELPIEEISDETAIKIEKIKSDYYTNDFTIVSGDNSYDDDTVVLIMNQKNIDLLGFEIGAKLSLSTAWKQKVYIKNDIENIYELRNQLNNMNFKYKNYLIGAIIADNSARDIKIMVNPNEYYNLTGKNTDYSETYIFTSTDDIETLFNELRVWAEQFFDVSVVNLKSAELKEKIHSYKLVETQENIKFILIVITLVLIFAINYDFTLNRKNEINILRSFGCSRRKIKKILLFTAVIFSIILELLLIIASVLFNSFIFILLGVLYSLSLIGTNILLFERLKSWELY